MGLKQITVAILTPLLTGTATLGAIALHHHQQTTATSLSSRRSSTTAQSDSEEALQETPLAQWPQQCEALRQELQSQPQLTERTYEARPIQPFVTPAWKLNWQGDTIALPLAQYSEVRAARNEDGQLMVMLRAESEEIRVVLNHLRKLPAQKDVFTTVPHPRLMLASLRGEAAQAAAVKAAVKAEAELETKKQESTKALKASVTQEAIAIQQASVGGATETVQDWDGPSLTNRLFGGAVELETLIDHGYRHRPRALSCGAEAWEKELPIAMGLALKLLADSPLGAPEVAYAKVGQHSGRVLLRRAEGQTHWQARVNGEQDFYSDVTISLPSDHESVEVGLGLGQDSWWDAEPRPAWLIALERAVEVDSTYAWDALSVELHRSGMSEASAASIQLLMAE